MGNSWFFCFSADRNCVRTFRKKTDLYFDGYTSKFKLWDDECYKRCSWTSTDINFLPFYLKKYSTYRKFRLARAELRDRGRALDSLILSEFLDEYAETGNEYVKVLQKIIKQNNLKDFDDAKLLPESIELKSLI